jgi:hypothetical protein
MEFYDPTCRDVAYTVHRAYGFCNVSLRLMIPNSVIKGAVNGPGTPTVMHCDHIRASCHLIVRPSERIDLACLDDKPMRAALGPWGIHWYAVVENKRLYYAQLGVLILGWFSKGTAILYANVVQGM